MYVRKWDGVSTENIDYIMSRLTIRCLWSSTYNGILFPVTNNLLKQQTMLIRFVSRRTVIVLSVYKISSLKITLPKTLQLKTLDFLQQTITMNENAQWQMIKDSVLFALSSGFSVSLFHFYLKKSIRVVLFCISSFFSLHRSLYLLLAYCLYWR